MFPPDILVTYLAATVPVVIAPGPDNVLAIGRVLGREAGGRRRDPHRCQHFDTGAGPAALTRRMATACFAQGLRES